MTTIVDVTKRLQVQAQGTESADCQGNLADYIWMLKHQGVASNTDEIWEALLQDFENLNTLLNAESASAISRSLVYAVNGLLAICVNVLPSEGYEESIRNQMRRLNWRIVIAWDAILAGDIDSIREHVQLEESARVIA